MQKTNTISIDNAIYLKIHTYFYKDIFADHLPKVASSFLLFAKFCGIDVWQYIFKIEFPLTCYSSDSGKTKMQSL